MTTKAQESKTLEEFRQRKLHQTLMKKIENDLRKSQLACEQLDTQAGITVPCEKWYWATETQDSEESSDEEDEEIEVTLMGY